MEEKPPSIEERLQVLEEMIDGHRDYAIVSRRLIAGLIRARAEDSTDPLLVIDRLRTLVIDTQDSDVVADQLECYLALLESHLPPPRRQEDRI